MSGNMIPSVLIQNSVVNENQDSVLNTVRLTPNSFSNNTVVFVVPKSGSVLDHNSSLVWTVSWDNYDNTCRFKTIKWWLTYFTAVTALRWRSIIIHQSRYRPDCSY